MHLTIGRKILAGYAVILFLLVVTAVVAYRSLQSAETMYGAFLDVDTPAVMEAEKLASEAREQIAEYRGALSYPGRIEEFARELRESHRRFDSTLVVVRRLTHSDAGNRLLDRIASIHRQLESTQEQGIRFLQTGKRDEAIALGTTLVPMSSDIKEATTAFMDLQQKRVAAGRLDASDAVRRSMWQMASISVVAILLGLGFGYLLSRSITLQLRETIAQLSTSSAEILATTSQVAAGAAQTSSAVAETTATVEEVKQTAQLSTQKARSVSEAAQRASEVSRTGTKNVEETVEGMQRIQEQMESIAATIMRLSEQSQSIAEIIATVNDLAEQSNLLAVNAAIEAARAGDEGKGFAIVAQEVRSLAAQSKQATAQVRSILGDIQKAMTAAVLATEKGHKAVETGARQSAAAGDSIRLLSESIGEAAQAAMQIAASSKQQTVGMDQVALAMENIKQASIQNVAGTRQAEMAARNLHDLGQRLNALIGRNATAARGDLAHE